MVISGQRVLKKKWFSEKLQFRLFRMLAHIMIHQNIIKENNIKKSGMRDVSLMNRLSKTESAVYKLWMLYFQRISFQII